MKITTSQHVFNVLYIAGFWTSEISVWAWLLRLKILIRMEEINFLFIMSYSVTLQANSVDVCAGPDEAEA